MTSASTRRSSGSRGPAAVNQSSISSGNRLTWSACSPGQRRDQHGGHAEEQGKDEHAGYQPPPSLTRRATGATHPHHGANATGGGRRNGAPRWSGDGREQPVAGQPLDQLGHGTDRRSAEVTSAVAHHPHDQLRTQLVAELLGQPGDGQVDGGIGGGGDDRGHGWSFARGHGDRPAVLRRSGSVDTLTDVTGVAL